jgi:hypothetical protein
MHHRAPRPTRIGFPAHARRGAAPFHGILPALLLLAALSGCAKTKVPVSASRLAEGTPAVSVRPSGGIFGNEVFVSKVDGVRVKFKESFFDNGRSAPVRVAAGFHEVEVTIDGGQIQHFLTFDIDFKAGHTYRVGRAGSSDDRVRLDDLTAGTSLDIRAPTKL